MRRVRMGGFFPDEAGVCQGFEAGGFFLGLSAVWDSLAFGMALAGGYCLCLMLLRNGREQKIALGPFLSMGLMFGMFRSMGA